MNVSLRTILQEFEKMILSDNVKNISLTVFDLIIGGFQNALLTFYGK